MPGGTAVSPYVYEARDSQGYVIRGVFNFDDETRALGDLEAHRDPECAYTKIVVGVGSKDDPTVEGSGRKVTVPEGDTTITATQLDNVGLTTIDDILELQITAIP
jgi:hypothetical protein